MRTTVVRPVWVGWAPGERQTASIERPASRDSRAAGATFQMKAVMQKMKHVVAAVLMAGLAIAGPAHAQSHGLLARFDGGIGVDPVASVASPILVATPGSETFENVSRNFVRGVRS